MKIIFGQGNYFDGKFSNNGDIEIVSFNPAINYQTIYQTKTAKHEVNDAVASAKKALAAWRALNQEERNKALLRLKESFVKNETKIAHAISLEMGKIYKESLLEAKNLSARIDLTITDGLRRVATEKPAGILGETRYHSQGVLAVLGPYNFPAHLVNAHVIPALLTGNTVVVKFSEVCPWVGELYAQCIHESNLPAGVFNMIQGKADIGQALVKHPEVRGILFTGSYATGRKLKEATLDEPNKMLALEMGGKNIAVVLKDAHLFQALSEIVQGAFLTTGQRCTATSRVLIEKSVATQFIDSLTTVIKKLEPGDPFSAKSLFGPLASKNALDNYWSILQKIPAEVETLVSGKLLGGGAFVTPSLHLLKNNKAPGYIDTELFGPDICVQIINGVDEAISLTNESPYGLSNALFTKNQNAFEQFYQETYSGVLNLNRSTNGAYGAQPFGGLGKSGNQRAAGIDAVRYTTYPVAVNHLAFGETTVDSNLTNIISPEQSKLKISLETLTVRHKIESLLESINIPFDEADNNFIKLPINFLNSLKLKKQNLNEEILLINLKPYAQIDFTHLTLTISENKSAEFCNTCETFFSTLYNENYLELANIYADKINIPESPILPRSQAMLERLYRNNFVPKEKKTAVINLNNSRGAYLASIDDDPLVLFDAASQIASIGTGFQADTFINALTGGDLTASLLANCSDSKTAQKWIDKYTNLLLEHANNQIKHASFTSSGAEANEKAFDLCRLNGPGGTKIIAFEGSFHGRTIMSLQATYNPEKRKQFEFAGFEATFVPFPKYLTPNEQPEIPAKWISSWSSGNKFPTKSDDLLLNAEISSLSAVDVEIRKGNICAVIIEPMQCEGGDNYATARFFNGLRALTRYHQVPLIFDEVQTGFGLLGPFYAHTAFDLKDADGNIDGPDCITLAKKAQLGACLSRWEDTRPSIPHVTQVIRGFLQAEAMLQQPAQGQIIEKILTQQLQELQNNFSDLVFNPRCKSYAMAFDLPNNHLAMQLINQRFYRGLMVYIAGEKTVRFRFNLKTNNSELKNFDNQLKDALTFIQKNIHSENDKVPEWIKPTEINNKNLNNNKNFPDNFTLEVLNSDNWALYKDSIEKIEQQTYEKGRRDSIDFLHDHLKQDGGLGLVLLEQSNLSTRIAGYSFGGPLENSSTDGATHDIMRGKNNTFYSANLVLRKNLRGQGLGTKLKKAQLNYVRSLKKSDGSNRYDYMTGRNKVGFTAEISKINQSLGAQVIETFGNQYGKKDAQATYYRINLRTPNIEIHSEKKVNQLINWSDSIQAPLGSNNIAIFNIIADGYFTPVVGTKLTLSNWVTPNFVRYAELLQQLIPDCCPHSYFTSGQAEIVDKGLRSLRVHRENADVVIGLTDQFVGTSTAAARSISDGDKLANWFNWPKAAHPEKVGIKQSLLEIKNLIKQYSADKILGIVVELIGEKSGYVASEEFLNELDQIRAETNVPLIFVETTSALGRNGQSLFKTSSLTTQPNMIWWFTGAQLGHVFVDDTYYVSKPLTLISTWDSDEISILRNYQHLIAANQALHKKTAAFFADKFNQIKWPMPKHGEGLWQVLNCLNSQQAKGILELTQNCGLVLQKCGENRIVICPPVDVSINEMNSGLEILKNALSQTATY